MRTLNLCIYGMIALLGWGLYSGYGIRWNRSDSLPNTFYWSIPYKAPLQYGEIVTFTLSESPAVFAKKVAGLPGDQIEISDSELYINGIKRGSLKPSITAISSAAVPNGFFFALGEHPESFDSRYAEFGFVPQSQIIERLWPIF